MGSGDNSSSSESNPSQGNTQDSASDEHGFEYYMEQVANVAKAVAFVASVTATAISFITAISSMSRQRRQEQ